MAASVRAFVLRHTRLRPIPGLDDLRLHLADEVLPLWRAVQVETRDDDAALPYWAFAWGGGLAIGRYLVDHPEAVAGRRVLDVASGSGLCGIAALRAGAMTVMGADIELAKLDLGSGLKHHLIPMSWVDHVEDDKLYLDRTKDAAKADWREKH